ncbi:hypothetical protein SERLADRAFT_404712 [Serpula lacrymans var. lacrymans S7.9]|uniref:Uncharacterized protein n=1 Tax=Serpula lacrymans var. lacrymans (strain S7.9) TaxID=578457 RepID=F8NEI8_SERL9|nr:uncharacterized protein SERLADRAFT_404712 [Serpula lacrymans var. lacrymans S7.9]EGO30622.1 hypothetical protein SERLADRAFT_404712 [Serpula lacrymans var. lacrymans S7.9]
MMGNRTMHKVPWKIPSCMQFPLCSTGGLPILVIQQQTGKGLTQYWPVTDWTWILRSQLFNTKFDIVNWYNRTAERSLQNLCNKLLTGADETAVLDWLYQEPYSPKNSAILEMVADLTRHYPDAQFEEVGSQAVAIELHECNTAIIKDYKRTLPQPILVTVLFKDATQMLALGCKNSTPVPTPGANWTQPLLDVIGSAMKGNECSHLESHAAGIFEDHLEKVRTQLRQYTQPLCAKASETGLPPLRDINHTIPLIDETKIYAWRPFRCLEPLRAKWSEK